MLESNSTPICLQSIKKIEKYLCNETIQFQWNEITGDLQLYIIKLNKPIILLTLLINKKWNEIKKTIDKKLSIEISNDCSICLKDNIKYSTFCVQCNGEICINCYIEIFRLNQGIFICPYCRYTYGKLIQENMIELNVQKILHIFYIIYEKYYENDTIQMIQNDPYYSSFIQLYFLYFILIIIEIIMLICKK